MPEHPPRTLPRFHCHALPAPGSEVELDQHESRHAWQVMRLRAGDPLQLFDGTGTVADATALGMIGKHLRCRIEQAHHLPASRPTLTVAAALPKGERAPAMVRALSEVGVDRLVVLRTQRTVVEPRESRLDKLQRGAIEAAKQCGRTHLLQIKGVVDFDQLLRDASARADDIKLIAHTTPDGADPLTQHRARASEPPQGVWLLIGPEGGWTDAELAQAGEAGFDRWHFGPWVMRIETAAVAAAAIVRYLTAAAPDVSSAG